MINYNFIEDSFTDAEFISVSNRIAECFAHYLKEIEKSAQAAGLSVNPSLNTTSSVGSTVSSSAIPNLSSSSSKISTEIQNLLSRLDPKDIPSYTDNLLLAMKQVYGEKSDIVNELIAINKSSNPEEARQNLKEFFLRHNKDLSQFYSTLTDVLNKFKYLNQDKKTEMSPFIKIVMPGTVEAAQRQSVSDTSSSVRQVDSNKSVFSVIPGIFWNEEVPIWVKVLVGLGASAGVLAIVFGAMELYRRFSYGSDAYELVRERDGTERKVFVGGDLLYGILGLLGGAGAIYLSYLLGKQYV